MVGVPLVFSYYLLHSVTWVCRLCHSRNHHHLHWYSCCCYLTKNISLIIFSPMHFCVYLKNLPVKHIFAHTRTSKITSKILRQQISEPYHRMRGQLRRNQNLLRNIFKSYHRMRGQPRLNQNLLRNIFKSKLHLSVASTHVQMTLL